MIALSIVWSAEIGKKSEQAGNFNIIRTNVCILLTNRNRYDIMQEYRYRMLPVLFCHTLKCVWRSSPLTEGEQNFLRSRAGFAREVFSAYCAAPEPSERRAVMGFVSVQIFER